MTETPHPLPADLAAALAGYATLDGIAVRYFPELASTNDTAAALAAAGAADGTVIIAERQTAGRGRRGRTWNSPAAMGLYLSVVLRGRQPPVVTLLAGVAVAEAVRETTGVPAELKWPNDVVVEVAGDGVAGQGRRKVAGILTEALPQGRAGDGGAVIGIGVNVGARAFPPELTDRAAALEALVGCPRESGNPVRRHPRAPDGVASAHGGRRNRRRGRALACAVAEQPGRGRVVGGGRDEPSRRDRRDRRQRRPAGCVRRADRTHRRRGGQVGNVAAAGC